MVTTLLLAVVMLGDAPASPTPPPQIIEVKSRYLCQALTERVQPAILGLMKNDQIIEEGRRGLLKTADDGRIHANQQFDLNALRDVANAIQRNAATIDTILADAATFKSAPGTADEQLAAEMKKRLIAILARQKLVMNAIYATVETSQLGGMENDLPPHNITAQPGSEPAADPEAFLSNVASAGIHDPVSINMATLIDTNLPGKSIYDVLASVVTMHQAVSQKTEGDAAVIVVAAVQKCGVPASPSPPP